MWKPHQLSTMYCAIWLVDLWPIMILGNYIIILRFLIENSSNKSTKSLIYFPFGHLENNEINENILKKAMVGVSREIWWKTWRFPRKPEESWQACAWILMRCCIDQQNTCKQWNTWEIMSLHNFLLFYLRKHLKNSGFVLHHGFQIQRNRWKR